MTTIHEKEKKKHPQPSWHEKSTLSGPNKLNCTPETDPLIENLIGY